MAKQDVVMSKKFDSLGSSLLIVASPSLVVGIASPPIHGAQQMRNRTAEADAAAEASQQVCNNAPGGDPLTCSNQAHVWWETYISCSKGTTAMVKAAPAVKAFSKIGGSASAAATVTQD